MRDRLLIRHFLWRFLEHDLVSPHADRRGVLSATGGALVALSSFLAILIATPYQFFNLMPPGLASIQSLDDRFLLVSASMLVMALTAVAQWDALALDQRDTEVLGPLPIPRAVIIRSKFAATTLFAFAVVLAWNLPPTFLRVAAVPIGLPIGLGGMFRLTLAHGVVTIAAGAFGFLAVLGLREVVSAVLGPTQFRRISAVLQASLVVLLTTTLLLLPGSSRAVGRRLAEGSTTSRAVPALWFVGLHETLAGAIVDDVPRTHPRSVLATAEHRATELYRSLWPVYHELADIAIVAFLFVTVVTIFACAWNNRRLPLTSGQPLSRGGVVSRGWNWGVGRVVARTPAHRAGFFFTVQTLSRRVSHRVAMATSLAIGLSLVVLAVSSGAAAAGGSKSIPVSLLATQPLLLASLVIGFRHAARIPAELRAGPTFRLSLSDNAAPYISGVKRAGGLVVVVPTVVALALWGTTMLGPRVALLHALVGLSLSVLLIETLFVRCRRVPFVSGYVPAGDAKATGMACLVSVLVSAYGLAWVERAALETMTGVVVLVAILLGLAAGVKAFDRNLDGRSAVLELDDEAIFETQRLNLAERM